MRYKVWRSTKHQMVHVIVPEGAEIPHPIGNLGTWFGTKEGEVVRLKPAYRALLAEQGFCLVYRHLTQFRPEVD